MEGDRGDDIERGVSGDGGGDETSGRSGTDTGGDTGSGGCADGGRVDSLLSLASPPQRDS